MKKYLPVEIEPKWQRKWREDALYRTDLSDHKNPYYVLVELPYTSGDLHMGHWFTFTMGDVLARFKRMESFDVVFPNGFDAFGLPAENAAIKRGIHPQDWTYANAENMRAQFDTMGSAIDWTKTMIACDPEYYKWNQWLFLKMHEKGLAYRGKMLSNWCPNCQTVLANENVEAGKCWRCGTEVVQKEIDQWFIKITSYADRLIWDKNSSADWPKPLTDAQNNWIGKSVGVELNFDSIKVFTTRPDTLYGVTFLVINPEHELLNELVEPKNRSAVEEYILLAKTKSELERKENKEKSGVFTGSYVKHPLTHEDIPVWVADYVLPGYGTGAVMGVPGHDERDFAFAKKFDLPIKRVIEGGGLPYEGEGEVVESGEFTGLDSAIARERITKYLETKQIGSEKVQYHLHDWSISRQRYWGTPIPMIHCEKCGIVPVPEKDLPVVLPYEVDYTPKGKPPLATNEEWMQVECPKCGGPAKREPETMDTFIDSSWYFFRYLDPRNNDRIFNPEVIKAWMPVKVYIGGTEHTLGHALYSRFVTKFLHDLGLIDFDEYADRRIHHGIILGPDGSRMSKSRGNIVNPDHQVKEFGADAVRAYLCFLGPFDIVTPWKKEGINGIYHFLQRVWGLYDKVTLGHPEEPGDEGSKISSADKVAMNRTIKKVSEDIDGIKFNTAIAGLMEWLNYLSRKDQVSKEEYKNLVLMLAPFAPHITEELWEMLGEKYSIHAQTFPGFDKNYLEGEEVAIAVQVNGKVRETIVVEKDIVNRQSDIEIRAKKGKNTAKFLEGKTIKKVIYIPGKVINFVVE